MAVNRLDIDPKNFSFDFGRDWAQFRDGRIRKFLLVWLEKEIHEAHLKLENAGTVDELRQAQGAIKQARRASALVGKEFSDEAVMKDVLAFLEN